MAAKRVSPTTNRRVVGLANPLPDATPIHAASKTSAAVEVTPDTIRALERSRLQSLVDCDLDMAMALHAEDFQLINPAGLALSREDYLGALESGFINYLIFEPAGEITVYLSPESAVLRYLSNLEITVDGTLGPLRNYWHTDYYENRGGRWLAVLSHATKVST